MLNINVNVYVYMNIHIKGKLMIHQPVAVPQLHLESSYSVAPSQNQGWTTDATTLTAHSPGEGEGCHRTATDMFVPFSWSQIRSSVQHFTFEVTWTMTSVCKGPTFFDCFDQNSVESKRLQDLLARKSAASLHRTFYDQQATCFPTAFIKRILQKSMCLAT